VGKKYSIIFARVPPREAAMLKIAAKAYRAPSVNWFVGEMIACMLNPARWGEFSSRLSSGTVQQTLDLGQSALLQERPRAVRSGAGTRKRREVRGRTAGKRRRRV